jgi:hypothetical protein
MEALGEREDIAPTHFLPIWQVHGKYEDTAPRAYIHINGGES